MMYQAYKSTYKFTALLILFMGILPFQTYASHIVGGEIGYQCLGDDQYEIILSVYRDCINAEEMTEFDDPASVGIFRRSTGELFQTLEMFFMRDDTLQEFLLDDCLMVQDPVCVHTTTYREVLSLPFIEGGYELVYQRCCRNATISNIIEPDLTGATFNVSLTEEALQSCNTSPQFLEWPPIFVCAGEFISYDHSAVDMDGDSLVYSICTPNIGATKDMPQPMTPSAPPYDTLVWLSPTYDLNNVLGAGRPLSINPRTGRIQARPELTGQFVVGICVEEYRDGVLLSATRRDFQYNVVPCTETEATPITQGEFQCESLTVNFTNGSTGANDFEWSFDFLGDSLLVSNEESPTHTYPDTGTYRVRLIAEPGQTCADTAFLNLRLVPNSVTADIDIQSFDCGDTTIVNFIDASTDTISSIDLWQWNIIVGDSVYISDDQSPTFLLPRDTLGMAELTVRSNLGCIETVRLPFQTGIADPTANLPDTLFICAGDMVELNPLAPDNDFFNYRWRGGVLSPSPNIPNPIANPRNTTTYTARIFPPNSACQVEHDVTVVVMDGPQTLGIETAPDCANALGVQFTALVQGADSLYWNFGDTTNIAFLPGDSIITYAYPDTGMYDVRLVAIGPICTDTLVQTIIVDGTGGMNTDVSVNIEQDLIETCDPSVSVSAMVNNATAVEWINEQDSVIAIGLDAVLPLNGEIVYRVRASSTSGCIVEDTIQTIGHGINVELPGNQDLCLGDTVNLGITNLGFDEVNYRWTPDSLIISGADTPNPVVSSEVGERFYQLFMDNEFGCEDSTEIRVTVIDPDLELTFESAIQCDGTSVQLVNTTPIEYSRYQWLLGDSLNTEVIGDSIVFNYQIADTFQVCLTLDYDAPCVDTVCQMVTTIPSEMNLMPLFNFNLVNCDADSITIQFTNETTHSFPEIAYEWIFGDSTIVNEENPIQTFYETELLDVRLTAQASETCESSIMQAIRVDIPSLQLDSITRLCPGNTIVLNPGGNENLRYVWTPEEGLDNPTAASPMANPNNTTTYTVVVSHPLDESCQIMGQTTIDVDGVFDLGLPEDIATCGEELEIGVFPIAGVTVNWMSSEGDTLIGDTITVAGDYEGLYFVEVGDTTGCSGLDTINFINRGLNIIEPIGDTITTCEGQTVRVGLSNGNPMDTLSVAWTPLDLITRDSNTISPTFFGITDTILTLYYTATNQFGCMQSDSLAFKIRDFDVRLPPDDFQVCANSPSELNPDFNPLLEYTWSPATGLDDATLGNPIINISDTTTYSVQVTVGQGIGACRDSFIVGVGIRDGVILDIADDAPSLCEPAPIVLRVNGNENINYEWSDTPDFEMIIGDLDSVMVVPDIGATEYYVRATDGGCVTIDTVTVNTFPIDVSLPDLSEVCMGGGTTLSVTNNGLEQNLTFDWSPAEIITDGQGTSTPTIDTDEAMLLSAVVTNDFGCTATVETELELIDLSSDDITLTAFPDTIVLGGSTQLQVFVQGEFEYTWTPSATLDDPTSDRPIATPEETTLYELEIAQGNCTGIQEIEVVVLTDVCREPFIFVPAAFTPNGDGRNDVLFVRGNAIQELFFAVYNRWGELVFQTSDPSIGWDGMYKGEVLNSDVYGYYLEVTCIDGMEFSKQGDITILK